MNSVRRSRYGAAILSLAICAAGICAITPAGCATQSATSARSRGADVITGPEARETSAVDAFEVVRLLRPAWLRSRAAPSLSNPEATYARIYVDNVPMAGGTRDLRNIATGDIHEIRYLSPTEATTRFGTGHSGGVIMVMTRRGG